MTEENYRPRSPDFSSPSHSDAISNANSNFTFNNPTPYAPQSPVNQRASYDASPFFSSSYQRPTSSSRVPQQYVPPFHDFDEMARRSSRLQPADAPVPVAPEPMPAVAPLQDEALQARPGAGIEVKTKFPVARIKRIMQADEDVGKVAQVTPIAVCKSQSPSSFVA
jgi:hypothetical protein